jgi:O-antigen/teichoic acid export membrane protein
MNASFSGHGRHALGCAVRVFLADALTLPTGLVTTAVLTRYLGTDGFGQRALISARSLWRAR